MALNTVAQSLSTNTDGKATLPNAAVILYAQRLLTDANGTKTITFANNTFPIGSYPIVSTDIEAPAGSNYIYTVQVIGPTTATGFTVEVYRVLKIINVVGLGNLSFFQSAGANVAVHVIAMLPTL